MDLSFWDGVAITIFTMWLLRILIMSVRQRFDRTDVVVDLTQDHDTSDDTNDYGTGK